LDEEVTQGGCLGRASDNRQAGDVGDCLVEELVARASTDDVHGRHRTAGDRRQVVDREPVAEREAVQDAAGEGAVVLGTGWPVRAQ
jgi:hypothetical protein